MKQKKELILPIATFLVVGIILSGLYIIVSKQAATQNRERYRYIAASQSNMIRDCIDTVLARAYTLGALVFDNDGSTAFSTDRPNAFIRKPKTIQGFP